jgi:hypothetical protein
LSGNARRRFDRTKSSGSIFLTLAKRPFWQGFCPAHRSGTLFSNVE